MVGNAAKMPERRWRGIALAAGIFLLLAVLIPIFTLGLRSRSQNPAEGSPSPSTTPQTGAVEVQRGTIKRMLVLDGDLRAVRSRTVYAFAQEDAKIVFLPPEGTVVKAGERVVELDSTALLTRIKDNEERVNAADSEIVRTAADDVMNESDLINNRAEGRDDVAEPFAALAVLLERPG